MAEPEGLVSRRRFLTASAGAAIAASVSLERADAAVVSPSSSDARRVVVVGAGLAGLTTALDLVGAGWEVVVLEARDRVGGRVRTHHFDDGLHAELGGESIDDNHHAIVAMVDRFGLQTERRAPLKPYDANVYRAGLRQPLATFVAGQGGRVGTDYLRFYDELKAASAGVDPEHPERFPKAAGFDARTLDEFITSVGLVPEAEFLIRTAFRGEYNAEARDLSFLFIAQQAQGEDPGLLGVETMRIAGGNTQLAERMAAALGDRIKLSSPVTRIGHGKDGVVVTSGRTSIAAAHVVLALPMPPLRKVVFDPLLPVGAAAMIAGLDLGQAAKVVTEYAARFWQAEGFSGFTLTDLPFHIGWSPTDSYLSVAGLLSQFITGDAAVDAAKLSDGSRIATSVAQLDQVYPEGAPLRTGRAATMAWVNEPYTGGGYAIFRPGQMAPFWPVLRDGVGRILFAGEHTEVLIGYMESAIRSGHRIAARLGTPPSAASAQPAAVEGSTLATRADRGRIRLPATGGRSWLLPAAGVIAAGLAGLRSLRVLRRQTTDDAQRTEGGVRP